MKNNCICQSNSPKVIAAFDFDGTLTHRDSLPSFLSFIFGPMFTLGKLALQVPSLLACLLGFKTRQEAKESILHAFIKGMSIDSLRALGADFANQQLDSLVHEEGMKRLQWHQSQGHTCVLVSANLDLYLVPWGKTKGFDRVICSKVEATPEGTASGKLVGLNCWGPEKVRRLLEEYGPKENYQLYAYGDSRGDHALLAIADFPFYRKLN